MFTTPNRCDCTSSAQNNELVHKSNRYNCAPCTKTDMFALTSPNRYACAHSTNPNCSHSAKPIWLSSQHPADLLALATPKRYHCAHSTEMICLCSQHQTDTIISFVDHVVATTGHACLHTAEIHVVPVLDILPLILLEIRAQILMLVAAAAGSNSETAASSPHIS